MASLAQIINDPNYVNANAATKAAIFEKYAAQDPNYANANPATQAAIRSRFGLESVPAAGSASPAGGDTLEVPAGRQMPAWAAEYPGLYGAATGARKLVGPTVEALAVGGGAVAGAPLGPIGAAVGGGLGYGMARSGLRAVDTFLGLEEPETLPQAMGRGVMDVVGATTLGAVADKAIPLVGAATRKVSRGVGSVIDTFTGRGADVRAGQILRDAAGNQLGQIRQLNAMAPANVTSTQAAVDANQPTYAALGELAARRDPTGFYYNLAQGQEAARMAALQKATPALKPAEGARTAASQPFYQAADAASVPIDRAFKNLFSRMPKGTLERAADIARMEGRPFRLTEQNTGLLDAAGKPITQPPVLSGEDMHYIKRALSDIAYPQTAQQGIGRDAQRAAQSVLDDFVTAFEKAVPAYKKGREAYAAGSVPVNQSVVLNRMRQTLEAPAGGERVTPFLNVLGAGEQALLKRSTGMPRFNELGQVLSADQMKVVGKIAGELRRDATLQGQAQAGRAALAEIIRGDGFRLRLPAFFSRETTLTNKGLDILEASVSKRTMEKIVEAMKSGQSANDIMSVLPTSERNKLLRFMSDSRNFVPTAGGKGAFISTVTPEGE